MKIADFVKDGISVINNMGEYRKTIDSSIVFRNGWVASIIDKTKMMCSIQKLGYSVAACDYDGYFDWNILKQFGANECGTYECDTESEVCVMLQNIKNL